MLTKSANHKTLHFRPYVTDGRTDGRTWIPVKTGGTKSKMIKKAKKVKKEKEKAYTSCKISKKYNVPISSNIQERLFFSQKLPKITKICKTRIFLKKGFRVNLYPLMVSNFMQNIKKIYWANIEQYTKKWILSNCSAHFCAFLPFFGAKSIFTEKWQYHLKRLMVLYLHAKNYKKRLNGSKVIVIWKIERSDWSRAFAYKSRE